MKYRPILISLFACLILSGMSLPGTLNTVSAQSVHVGVGVNVADTRVFYGPLAPYGRWFTFQNYGWVWAPRVVAGWRPYTVGYWAYTDDGPTWVSGNDWGWATDHYGRWLDDSVNGWLWVPDTVWGPAWVDWQYCDGFIGWAPLSPAFGFGPGGLFFGPSFGFLPFGAYSFVRSPFFFHHGLGRFVEFPGRNRFLLGQSHRFTNYGWFNGRVINRSFSRDFLERSVGHGIAVEHIRDVGSPGLARGGGFGRGEVSMFRPSINGRAPAGIVPGQAGAARVNGAGRVGGTQPSVAGRQSFGGQFHNGTAPGGVGNQGRLGQQQFSQQNNFANRPGFNQGFNADRQRQMQMMQQQRQSQMFQQRQSQAFQPQRQMQQGQSFGSRGFSSGGSPARSSGGGSRGFSGGGGRSFGGGGGGHHR